MHKRFTVSAIQMNADECKDRNLSKAKVLIEEAVSKAAKIIALPETFNWRGDLKKAYLAAESIPGKTTQFLSQLASKYKIYIIGGSIIEKIPNQRKVFNTCIVFNPKGQIKAIYRKIHLFEMVNLFLHQ